MIKTTGLFCYAHPTQYPITFCAAAVDLDGFMCIPPLTLLPVVVSAPFASESLTRAASIYSVAPPMEVQARPMTTPGGVVS